MKTPAEYYLFKTPGMEPPVKHESLEKPKMKADKIHEFRMLPLQKRAKSISKLLALDYVYEAHPAFQIGFETCLSLLQPDYILDRSTADEPRENMWTISPENFPEHEGMVVDTKLLFEICDALTYARNSLLAITNHQFETGFSHAMGWAYSFITEGGTDEVPGPGDHDAPPEITTFQPVSDEDVDEIFGLK